MSSILIGKISNVHGIKGEVKIYPYTDDLDNFCKRKILYSDSELTNEYKVVRARVHKNMIIAKLSGIDDVESALKLKNSDIYIDKSSLEKLDEDTYYIDDLIGMDVIDDENVIIGKITYVFNNGANDVYEVKTLSNDVIYLPAIHDVIKKIDIVANKMYIYMMDGLI